ncbi:MAG: hypothetical protein IPG47_10845 [Thermoflexaceae bacterium]|nr:hypothetical protein [Thermoflexaceae bacterium]
MAEGGATVYPSDPGEAGLRLFLQWFGGYYARSTAIEAHEASESGVHRGVVNVGRRWRLAFSLLNTLAPDADLPFEAARAAVEQRLDGARQRVALWMPRGAHLPEGEPGLSQLLLQVAGAVDTEDGRKELRRPVSLYLRRQGTSGSVVTILGGLGGHWAQFTNRVPGTYYLNALELYRLPMSEELRDELTERIVLAAGQPEADDTQVIPAVDAWTVTPVEGDRAYVIGTPKPEDDNQASALRRNLRALLREAAPTLALAADAKALIVLGAATYADEEKLTWALRGMDPTLYAGYDLLVVIADGLVKPLLKPGRAVLPWDA